MTGLAVRGGGLSAQNGLRIAKKLERHIVRPYRANRNLHQQLVEVTRIKEIIAAPKRQLEIIFDAVPDPIVITSPDFRVMRVNKAMANRLGDEYSTIINKPCYEIICCRQQPPDFCPQLNGLTSLGQKMVQTEIELLGSQFSLIFVPTFDEKGELSGGVHIFQDLSERKRSEQAIKMSKERYDLATRAAKIGVWDWDPNTGDCFIDSNIMAFLGYENMDSPNNIKNWLDFVHPDDHQMMKKTACDCLTEKSEEFSSKHRLLHRDGSIIWVYVRGSVVRDGQRKVVKMVGTGMDITDLHRAEEENKALEKQLQQAQKMEALGTLTGGISHDFNNSLTVITGCAQLAMTSIPKDHPSRGDLELILKACRNAKNLVNQVSSFTRVQKITSKPTRFGPLLKEAIELLGSSIPSNIRMVMDVRKDSGSVMANPAQIHQLITNLGTNAAYAMKERGGMLKVTLDNLHVMEHHDKRNMGLEPGAYFWLTVADTGTGMSQEVMRRLFDPFFTTKDPGEGSGMGLAVVHGIVNSCGGKIDISSTPGKGSKFDVYLPLVSESPQDLVREEVTAPKGEEHILLVDDDVNILDTMKRMLQHLGYRVTVATNGTEALELLRDQPESFDLIFTDQVMPQLSGLELVRIALYIRPDIAVAVFTGFGEVIDKEEAQNLGVKSIVRKPLEISELAQRP